MRCEDPKLDKRGFTLVELMVTIALVAMVVLILSMALRLAIGAWEKGQRDGEGSLGGLSLARVMEKQLDSVILDSDVPARARKGHLGFCGDKDSVSFFSSFAPMGSPFQGVLRVTYIYDEESKTVSLYEQVVTRADDFKEGSNPMAEGWDGQIRPVSRIGGIVTFQLSYSGTDKINGQDQDQWKDRWECNWPLPPKAIRLVLGTSEENKREVYTWYFQIANQ